MNKFLAACLLAAVWSQTTLAQSATIRPKAVGISFLFADYVTAGRIRSTSLKRVLADKQWAKLTDMGTGIGVHYFQGLLPHMDFAGSFNSSFIKSFRAERNEDGSDLLMEADASVNLKVFTDAYWFTPYLNVGVGASSFKGNYGAIIPLGIGFKLNLFDEAAFFLNTQYRIPVTSEVNTYHFIYALGIAGTIGQKKAQ